MQEVMKPWAPLSSHRQTVIHFCAAQNFVEFLQDLAELGASIDLADNKGKKCMLYLAMVSGWAYTALP